MDIEDVASFKEQTKVLDDIDLCKLKDYILYIIEHNPNNNESYEEASKNARRKFKINPRKSQIIHYFRRLIEEKEIEPNDEIEKLFTKKLVRLASGVEVITLFTSPFPEYISKNTNEKKIQQFSCGKDCAYCPNEREIKVSCTVTLIEPGPREIKVSFKSEDPIDELRVITYIEKDGKNLYCRNYNNFNDDNRTFDVHMKNKFSDQLNIGDKVICVKRQQARSYISTEPGVRRANQCNYDAVLQFFDRASSLEGCGHNIDKVELLVLGGTWSHYPVEYQEEFVRDIYYAANIFYTRKERERLSLEEEIKINEKTKCRIIGLTLETRPDCINKYEIERFRRYNCTRVQIGVQHTNDSILKKINRGCYNKDTINALRLLKKNCYKVDYHLMPDLPGSCYEVDKIMFESILEVWNLNQIPNIDFRKLILSLVISFTLYLCINNLIISFTSFMFIMWNQNYKIYNLAHPELQADQWKIYPTEVTRWTKIYDWYNEGKYKPYAEDKLDGSNYNKLTTLILSVKVNVFPWIRLNRVIRDIPDAEIYGGNSCTNLRQHLHQILKDNGQYCKCIRCREVKNKKIAENDVKEVVRVYNGLEGTEYFISMESIDEKTLYGFCRLRINENNNDVMKILHNCALIRELHVYGVMTPHYSQKNTRTQHHGFGKLMLKKAEQIAYMNGVRKMAIISGVGVRQYYEKRGYHLDSNFMIKALTFQDSFLY